MRTTLTVEDGLIKRLKRVAADRGISFKQVVNEALHAGLDALGAQPRVKPFTTRTQPLKLRPGLDPSKLGQIADDDAAAEKMSRSP
jgi:hypothetical protein